MVKGPNHVMFPSRGGGRELDEAFGRPVKVFVDGYLDAVADFAVGMAEGPRDP